jgi:hypothetical protein
MASPFAEFNKKLAAARAPAAPAAPAAKKTTKFSFGGSKKAPAAAPAQPAKKGKDMRWGGRPDPTPELFVDEKAKKEGGNFMSQPWRLSKKRQN